MLLRRIYHFAFQEWKSSYRRSSLSPHLTLLESEMTNSLYTHNFYHTPTEPRMSFLQKKWQSAFQSDCDRYLPISSSCTRISSMYCSLQQVVADLIISTSSSPRQRITSSSMWSICTLYSVERLSQLGVRQWPQIESVFFALLYELRRTW